MTRILIASLIGAVVLFIFGFLFWGVLPVTQSIFSGATRFEVGLFLPRPLIPGGRARGLEGVGLLDLLTSQGEGQRPRARHLSRPLPKASQRPGRRPPRMPVPWLSLQQRSPVG